MNGSDIIQEFFFEKLITIGAIFAGVIVVLVILLLVLRKSGNRRR